MSYRHPEEAAAFGGPPPVTVCTDYIALRHLGEDNFPVTVTDPTRDGELLVAKMIELKYDDILFATVHTGVLAQVAD